VCVGGEEGVALSVLCKVLAPYSNVTDLSPFVCVWGEEGVALSILCKVLGQWWAAILENVSIKSTPIHSLLRKRSNKAIQFFRTKTFSLDEAIKSH